MRPGDVSTPMMTRSGCCTIDDGCTGQYGAPLDSVAAGQARAGTGVCVDIVSTHIRPAGVIRRSALTARFSSLMSGVAPVERAPWKNRMTERDTEGRQPSS